MMNAKVAAIFLGAASLLSGCASIVDGKNQVISVDTRSKAAPVVGAACKLTNDKGTWYVTSPGTTTVQRSYQDLNVQCEKTGLAPAVTAFKSATKGMAFGNIIFGGIIGAGVDIASGAAYDYPSPLTVEMSDLIDISRTAKVEPQQTADASGARPSSDTTEAERASLALGLTGCQTTALPVRFKQKDGISYFEARCSDARLVHAVCTEGDCKLRTSSD